MIYQHLIIIYLVFYSIFKIIFAKNTISGPWDNTYTSFDFWFYCIFLSIIYLIYKKDNKSYPLIYFLIVTLIYIEFGTMSPFYYVPFHKEPRYFTLITAPNLILLARSLYIFLNQNQNKFRKVIVVSLISGLFINSFFILNKYHKEYTKFLQTDSEIYQFLKDKPEANVWTDCFTSYALHFMFNYKYSDHIHHFKGEKGYGSIADISFINCNDKRPNLYVILTRITPDFQYKGIFNSAKEKSYVWNHPSNWRLIKRIQADKEIYTDIYKVN